MTGLFNAYVSSSDEALALQVLEVRGAKYIGLRSLNGAGINQAKTRKGKAPGEKTMCDTTDVYVKYHKLVAGVRDADVEASESRGWCEFLRDKQNELVQMRRSAGKNPKRKVSVLNSIELPYDKQMKHDWPDEGSGEMGGANK